MDLASDTSVDQGPGPVPKEPITKAKQVDFLSKFAIDNKINVKNINTYLDRGKGNHTEALHLLMQDHKIDAPPEFVSAIHKSFGLPEITPEYFQDNRLTPEERQKTESEGKFLAGRVERIKGGTDEFKKHLGLGGRDYDASAAKLMSNKQLEEDNKRIGEIKTLLDNDAVLKDLMPISSKIPESKLGGKSLKKIEAEIEAAKSGLPTQKVNDNPFASKDNGVNWREDHIDLKKAEDLHKELDKIYTSDLKPVPAQEAFASAKLDGGDRKDSFVRAQKTMNDRAGEMHIQMDMFIKDYKDTGNEEYRAKAAKVYEQIKEQSKEMSRGYSIMDGISNYAKARTALIDADAEKNGQGQAFAKAVGRQFIQSWKTYAYSFDEILNKNKSYETFLKDQVSMSKSEADAQMPAQFRGNPMDRYVDVSGQKFLVDQNGDIEGALDKDWNVLPENNNQKSAIEAAVNKYEDNRSAYPVNSGLSGHLNWKKTIGTGMTVALDMLPLVASSAILPGGTSAGLRFLAGIPGSSLMMFHQNFQEQLKNGKGYTAAWNGAGAITFVQSLIEQEFGAEAKLGKGVREVMEARAKLGHLVTHDIEDFISQGLSRPSIYKMIQDKVIDGGKKIFGEAIVEEELQAQSGRVYDHVVNGIDNDLDPDRHINNVLGMTFSVGGMDLLTKLTTPSDKARFHKGYLNSLLEPEGSHEMIDALQQHGGLTEKEANIKKSAITGSKSEFDAIRNTQGLTNKHKMDQLLILAERDRYKMLADNTDYAPGKAKWEEKARAEDEKLQAKGAKDFDPELNNTEPLDRIHPEVDEDITEADNAAFDKMDGGVEQPVEGTKTKPEDIFKDLQTTLNERKDALVKNGMPEQEATDQAYKEVFVGADGKLNADGQAYEKFKPKEESAPRPKGPTDENGNPLEPIPPRQSKIKEPIKVGEANYEFVGVNRDKNHSITSVRVKDEKGNVHVLDNVEDIQAAVEQKTDIERAKGKTAIEAIDALDGIPEVKDQPKTEDKVEPEKTGIALNGKRYEYVGVDRDKNKSVVSVRVRDAKGKVITVKDPKDVQSVTDQHTAILKKEGKSFDEVVKAIEGEPKKESSKKPGWARKWWPGAKVADLKREADRSEADFNEREAIAEAQRAFVAQEGGKQEALKPKIVADAKVVRDGKTTKISLIVPDLFKKTEDEIVGMWKSGDISATEALAIIQRKKRGYTNTELNAAAAADLNAYEKEISNKKKNKVILQQIESDAKNIIAGKKIFERFSPEEQRGFTEGGRIHVEASLLLAADERSGGQDNATSESQENRIEQFAKDKGVWTENTTESLANKYGEPIAAGQEAIVWGDPKNGKVIKTQDTFQYENLQQKLDGITLHNAYFPESSVKVLGYGRNAKGEFQIIVEQPFIQGEKLTAKEISNHLEALGFKEDEAGNFSNTNTIIEDVHTGNAIKDKSGNVIIIDPIMRLNTPEQGYGGTRNTNAPKSRFQIIAHTEDELNNLAKKNNLDPGKVIADFINWVKGGIVKFKNLLKDYGRIIATSTILSLTPNQTNNVNPLPTSIQTKRSGEVDLIKSLFEDYAKRGDPLPKEALYRLYHLWALSGYPEIRQGPGRAFYDNTDNSFSNINNLEGLVAELSHALQNVKGSELFKLTPGYKTQKDYDQTEYNREGSIEYDAHKVIESIIESYIYGGEIIDNPVLEKYGIDLKSLPLLNKFHIIGEKGASELDRTTNSTHIANLNKAKNMAGEGALPSFVKATPKQIFEATGWEKDKNDGKWKMSTYPLQLKVETIKDGTYKITDLFEGEILSAYPSLAKYTVKVVNEPGFAWSGKLDRENSRIIFNAGAKKIAEGGRDGRDIHRDAKSRAEDFRKTIIHEVQHYIQGNELFARGSSPSFYEKYIKYKSEVNPPFFKQIIEGIKKKLSQTFKTKDNEIYDLIDKLKSKGLESLTPNELYTITSGEVEARLAVYIAIKRKELGDKFPFAKPLSEWRNELKDKEGYSDIKDEIPIKGSTLEESTPSFIGTKMTPIGMEKFGQIMTNLNKAIGGVFGGVYSGEAFANIVKNKLGRDLATIKGVVYGFVAAEDGKIYINGDRLNANTPNHEYGHIFLDILKKANNAAYKRGLALAEKSGYLLDLLKGGEKGPYGELVSQYNNGDREGLLNEALAMGIGDQGEKIVNKSLKHDFVKWLADFWNNIKKVFGGKLSELTPEQLKKLTFKQFTTLAASELLSGETKNAISEDEAVANMPKSFEALGRTKVYRGLRSGVNETGGYKAGKFVTLDKENAARYNKDVGEFTIPSNLKLLKYNSKEADVLVRDFLEGLGENKGGIDKGGKIDTDDKSGLFFGEAEEAWTDFLTAKGYEGTSYLNNSIGRETEEIHVFDPNKIKSFDTNNNNIKAQITLPDGRQVSVRSLPEGLDGIAKSLAEGTTQELTDLTTPRPLDQVIEADEFFKLYPKAKDINVIFVNDPKIISRMGYSEDKNELLINLYHYEANSISNRNDISKQEGVSEGVERGRRMHGLLVVDVSHELQHFVQGVEGFSKGGVPDYFRSIPRRRREARDYYNTIKDSKNIHVQRDIKILKQLLSQSTWTEDNVKRYQLLAGEVEARNAARRFEMTPEQRKAQTISQTEDVHPDSKIYLKTKGDQFQIINDLADIQDENVKNNAKETQEQTAEENLRYAAKSTKSAKAKVRLVDSMFEYAVAKGISTKEAILELVKKHAQNLPVNEIRRAANTIYNHVLDYNKPGLDRGLTKKLVAQGFDVNDSIDYLRNEYLKPDTNKAEILKYINDLSITKAHIESYGEPIKAATKAEFIHEFTAMLHRFQGIGEFRNPIRNDKYQEGDGFLGIDRDVSVQFAKDFMKTQLEEYLDYGGSTIDFIRSISGYLNNEGASNVFGETIAQAGSDLIDQLERNKHPNTGNAYYDVLRKEMDKGHQERGNLLGSQLSLRGGKNNFEEKAQKIQDLKNSADSADLSDEESDDENHDNIKSEVRAMKEKVEPRKHRKMDSSMKKKAERLSFNTPSEILNALREKIKNCK